MFTYLAHCQLVFGLAKEKYYSLVKPNTLVFYGLLLLVINFSRVSCRPDPADQLLGSISNVISKAGRLVGRLLCGYSTSRQCNIFIGCKPHSRISVEFCNYCQRSHQLLWLRWLSNSPSNKGSSVRVPPGSRIFHILCPLRHTRSARNCPTSASAERATPKPHSLSYQPYSCPRIPFTQKQRKPSHSIPMMLV